MGLLSKQELGSNKKIVLGDDGWKTAPVSKPTLVKKRPVNPSDSLGDVEFRADLDPSMHFNPFARLGYEPTKGKVMATKAATDYANDDYFEKFPDPEFQVTMDGLVDYNNKIAQYFHPDTDSKTIEGYLLDDGYSQEQIDAKGIQGDDVLLSPAMAQGSGVWTHEYTHRGIAEIKNILGDDDDIHNTFVREYGADAYALLFTEGASEYITELFDTEMVGPLSKEETQDTDAFFSADQLQDDLKTGGSRYEDSMGLKGVKELIRAAEDVLKGREGEPEKYKGYAHGGLVHDGMEELNMDTPTDYTLSGGLPKEVAPEEGDRAALDAAVKEMRRKEADGPEPTFYDKDDQDFPNVYGIPPVESPEEALVPTPSVAIAQTEAALTEATVAPTVDVTLTGWSNLAGLESASLHVDPTGIITMGYGVVADGGVTLNGKAIDVTKGHGLTSTSALGTVDTSKAYKTVNGVKYKRVDYTSDELFSKAVYSGFYASAKKNITGFAKLDDEHVEAIIDIGYNAGEGAFKWNDIDTLSNEMQKGKADRSVNNITKFTQNFSADGKNGGGILRRRAIMANKVLGSKDQIAYIKQGNDVSGKTTFYLKRSDDTTVRSWEKATSTVTAYPTGKPILTIEGARKATAPIQASIDLTDWANAIT